MNNILKLWEMNLILMSESNTCLRWQVVFVLDHGRLLASGQASSQGNVFQTWGIVCIELEMQKGLAYVEDDF